MSILTKLRLLPGATPPPPRKRKTAEVSGTVEFLETSRLVAILVFCATVGAIVLISFVGVNTLNLPVLPNQLASVRIVASVPFSYVSAEKTRLTKEQRVNRLPPVYRLEMEPLRLFEAHIHELITQLDKIDREHSKDSPERRSAINEAVDAFNAKGPYRVSSEDVATVMSVGDAKTRFSLIENGLLSLREIYNEGVQDGRTLGLSTKPDGVTVFQITKPNGEVTQRPVQTMEDALTFLRINLMAEGSGRDVSNALFRIFRNGLVPNVMFDAEATARLRTEAVQDIKPVTEHVDRGQTIIEPGTRVTPAQYEMLEAHRKYVLEHGDARVDQGLQLFGRMLLVLGMVMASVFYIRLEDQETLQSNGRLALLALVVIVNLALVRLSFWLGELPFFVNNTTAASILPYIAPTALAPLIVAILLDYGSAMFMALLISIFASVIYGNRLDILVMTFVASMIAIFCSRSARKRGRVVRAAGLGGVTVAAFALLMGIVDQLPAITVLKQMAAGLGTGFVTGIIVVGVLPVLEGLFKRTTDITLLELTDFNHPLLRLMQMEAPGTYHHSLVVAQLSENAANAIGANPLVARACALFHDIGKTKKPEYFTENQRDRANPHDENNPSLSALIIKAHVKDGIDLALKHRLPRAVIDVIQQHHGTTLIRFFFQRALNDSRHGTNPTGSTAPMVAPGLVKPVEAPKVCESTYRYDGPKPQFKESAIIHLADGVEAASRSMKKVTPQHLGELIDQIFRDRIEDGQLDEAPITFEELSKIKSSFTFTLLNMLHSRVGYAPAEEGSGTPAPTKAQA
ncbi:phosphohydrolase [Opitutaceae bacterium EW11]|nr:phosphohydrolase [Opitutaceae bacterium EW11]